MADVILWTDNGRVIALTPPGGMTAVAAQAAYAPVASFIVDNNTLPDAPLSAWVLGSDGTVTVDQTVISALSVPRVVARSQGLKQLSADGKLDAYTTALSSADKLTQLLAQSPTWERADPRLNAMANALGYDTAAKIDAFFVAASKIT